jgi:hypothetical protein
MDILVSIAYLLLTLVIISGLYLLYIKMRSSASSAPAPASAPAALAAKVDASGAQQDMGGTVLMKQDAGGYVSMNAPAVAPYATTPIMSVDDYEYNMIFKNEGDRAMTKSTRDFLMAKYPKDWSTQPPSSDAFQRGLAEFKESFQDSSYNEKKMPDFLKNEAAMTPPDSLAEEMKEREILAKYTPKDAQSLTTYDAADAEELIKRIYSAKGVVPTYKKTGENQFTVYRTTPENKATEMEADEEQQAPASINAVSALGENTTIVPTIEYTGGTDPFFTPGEKTRDSRWDYTSWTPGLERMFAPNTPMQKWY